MLIKIMTFQKSTYILTNYILYTGESFLFQNMQLFLVICESAIHREVLNCGVLTFSEKLGQISRLPNQVSVFTFELLISEFGLANNKDSNSDVTLGNQQSNALNVLNWTGLTFSPKFYTYDVYLAPINQVITYFVLF